MFKNICGPPAPPTPDSHDNLVSCASPFAPQVRLSEADFKVLPRDELILR